MALPLEERQKRLATLTTIEVAALEWEWAHFWARPEQQLPPGDWYVWLILAGRGFGKTRTGAESVRQWVRSCDMVNLIGATADDVRDIMIEGESGILAICPPWERPRYVPSKLRLEWPNGARSLLFSAEEPERLRGKQHKKIWADEVCSWRYEEAWDQAMFGLRLGDSPQAIVTTTPKPVRLLKELLEDPGTVVTRGSTYDNRPNLSERFYTKIIRKYEGTRLGRQELNAEVLTDNPRALWNRANIDAYRVASAPRLNRVVVGVDPNVKNRDLAELRKASADMLDEAGIVVAGVGAAPPDWKAPPGVTVSSPEHFYIIDDRSLDAGPSEWGNAAVKAYTDHRADRIIPEVNNGGDMVVMLLQGINENVSVKPVTATRGKAIRAEPISALYEQGRVHHVGSFSALEDEMCDFDPVTTTKSPNRMDALVWALTELSDQTGFGLLNFMRGEAAKLETAVAHRPNGVPVTQAGWR